MDAKSDSKTAIKSNTKSIVIGVLAVGCGLFLLAHFVLAEWAEASLYGHDIQHILIFAGGVITGGASLRLLGKK